MALQLCTRHCAVCHRKLRNKYEALKPYVCDSRLCFFQYYALNLGPSLEVCPFRAVGILLLSFTARNLQQH